MKYCIARREISRHFFKVDLIYMFIEMKSRALDIDENLNIMKKIHIHNKESILIILL